MSDHNNIHIFGATTYSEISSILFTSFRSTMIIVRRGMMLALIMMCCFLSSRAEATGAEGAYYQMVTDASRLQVGDCVIFVASGQDAGQTKYMTMGRIYDNQIYGSFLLESPIDGKISVNALRVNDAQRTANTFILHSGTTPGSFALQISSTGKFLSADNLMYEFSSNKDAVDAECDFVFSQLENNTFKVTRHGVPLMASITDGCTKWMLLGTRDEATDPPYSHNPAIYRLVTTQGSVDYITADDDEKPVYYGLDGTELKQVPSRPGLYLCRQGGRTTKIIIH